MVDSDSDMGFKNGSFAVVIGYQVYEFTCTWFVEHFLASSHIYHRFSGKTSTLTHFLLEEGCKDYSYLD